jgi:hypothetical protein
MSQTTGSVITCASIVIDHYTLVDPRREERAVGKPATKCFERWRDETGTFDIHTIERGWGNGEVLPNHRDTKSQLSLDSRTQELILV